MLQRGERRKPRLRRIRRPVLHFIRLVRVRWGQSLVAPHSQRKETDTVRSNVTEMRIRALVLAGLFAVALLANTGIPVLAGNSGATKGSGTWTKTGSVNTARAFHTATLLQDGEVSQCLKLNH